jgi:hypothetical protein
LFSCTVVSNDWRHKKPELERINKATHIFASYKEGNYVLNNKKHQTVGATGVTVYR